MIEQMARTRQLRPVQDSSIPRDRLLLIALAALLAVLVTRGIVFQRGWIQHSADFSIHVDRGIELLNWDGAWNPYLGDDNAAIISQSPPSLLLLQIMNTEATQKVLLFLVYLLIAASMALSLYSWLAEKSRRRALALSALAAAVYTINAWVAVESVHFFYLLLYALLPATFHLVRRALGADSIFDSVRYGMLCGLASAATLSAYGIAFHGLLLVVVASTFLVWGGGSLGRRTKIVVTASGGYLLVLMLVSGYWLLPVMFGFRASFESGTSWALFATRDMFILSDLTPLWLNVVGFYRGTTAFLIDVVASKNLAGVAQVGGYALLFGPAMLLASSPRRRRWEAGSLVAGAAIFSVLAAGVGFPLGDSFARLSSLPVLNRLSFVLFKGPYKFIPLVVFCLIMATAYMLADLELRRMSSKFITAFVGIGVVSWSAIGGLPLLAGDLAGYMRPVSVPTAVRSSLAASGLALEDRVVWLPFADRVAASPWEPKRPEIPLIGGGLPPMPAWMSPGHLSSRSVTYLGPAIGRTLDLVVARAIESEAAIDIGAFLAANGRTAIAVRIDTEDGPRVAGLVRKRIELRRSYTDARLEVFRPTGRVAGFSPGLSLVAGGIEQIAAQSGRGAQGPEGRPFVLSAHLPSGFREWNLVHQVTLAPGHHWTSLALDAMDHEQFVQGRNLVQLTSPLGQWDREFFDSHTWLPFRTADLVGQTYEPTIAPSFLVAREPASLQVPIDVRSSGPHELWVRVFANPGLAAITTRVGPVSQSVPLSFDLSHGWIWVRALRSDLRAGRYTAHVQLSGSFNALDVMTMMPAGDIDRQVHRLRESLGHAELVSGGSWAAIGGLGGSPTLHAPREGLYRLVIRSRSGNPVAAKIDGRDVGVKADAPGWGVSASVDLTEGSHRLDVRSGLERSDVVLLWQPKSGSHSWVDPQPSTLDAGSAEKMSGQGSGMRLFTNPYNAAWRLHEGRRESVSIRANGFVNAFVLFGVGESTVAFGPQKWIVPGRIVSATGLTLLATVLIVARRRRRVSHD